MKKNKKRVKKPKHVKRHIGIDLHTDCFTFCILLEGAEPETHTWPLQDGLERLIEVLRPGRGCDRSHRQQQVVPRTSAGPRGARRGCRAGKIRGDSPLCEKDRQERRESHRFFLSKGMLPEARVKSRAHAELASAIGMRDQMTKQRVQYINKAYAMLNGHGVKIKKTGLTSKVGFERAMNSREWSKVERTTLQAMAIQLEAIRESRKVLDAEIAALAETLPGYKNLISIKGIGMLSAATFLAAIGDIKDFPKPGNLAAYIGVTPRVSQSNDTQLVGRITKRGNKAFRTRLVQCALIAIKYSPYLRDFYKSIKSRHGSGKAIIAVARKLLNTIFYTLRENRVFEDFSNYEFKTCN